MEYLDVMPRAAFSIHSSENTGTMHVQDNGTLGKINGFDRVAELMCQMLIAHAVACVRIWVRQEDSLRKLQ